jgi:3',5'-cyclic AMP phosphodiesterase CpdA
VVLDTVGVDGPHYYGHVDSEQLAWLERDLAKIAAGAAVVAVTHIPLMTGMLGNWAYREDLGSANTVVDVQGKKVFRHVVSNTADVLARFANARLSLVIGGHIHARERLEFVTSGRPLRIHQAASVVPPFNDAIQMVSGVTLYKVTGTEIDDGEFIRMDR